jgi:hypothetical protein
VPGAAVARFFDPVAFVPGALDGTGIGPVPARRVEVLLAGDVGHDLGPQRGGTVRGKAGPAARRTIRSVRVNLTRSGSIPALVAAVQIRALIA